MSKVIIYLISTLLLISSSGEAAKILVLFTFPATSHFGAFQPLFEELANRGHEVTVVSPFAKDKHIKNYKALPLENNLLQLFASDSNSSSSTFLFEIRQLPYWFTMIFMRGFVLQNCEMTLSQSNMQELIRNTELNFDLILYEPCFSECIYGLLHKFKAPSIQLVPNSLMPWESNPVGNPSTLSYVPSILSSSEIMNFFSRFTNVVTESFLTVFQALFIRPQMESIMRKYFPDPTLPSIRDLEESASFMFLHSHALFTHPRPLTPNTIEVGGLHITDGKNLPKKLQKFLDDAPHGFIYFSLGSSIRSVDLPEELRDGILKSFSKLKQKVLWKWETASLPSQPPNVHIEQWVPQHDILAHPNLKLFITHGGLMSLQEAVYFGIPLVIIPVGGDQKFNADVAKNRGLGVVISARNITEESLDWALQEVLGHLRYHEAVNELSKVFRDQPETPLDRAIFWIEYTIRHKGAKHLRSAALDLNFFQYYLLDVIGALLLVVFSLVYLMLTLGKITIRLMCSKTVKILEKKTLEKKHK